MKPLVQLRRAKDGAYHLVWRDKRGRGRKHPLCCHSFKIAEKARRTKEREIEQTGDFLIQHKSVRLSSLLTSYLADNNKIGGWTQEILERAFRYLMDAVGDIGIHQFKYKHALLFQKYIVESGRSEVTANIYMKALSPLFSWAFEQRLIYKNPLSEIELFPSHTNPVRFVEPIEFQQMMNNCPNKLWQARLLLARTASLRRGEVLNLTIDDVDFKRGVVRIQPKKDSPSTWRWHIRETRKREVPLVPEVGKLLAELVREIHDNQPYLLLTPQRYKRIMELKRQGLLLDRIRRFPDENWVKPFGRIRKRSGVQKATFDDLRKTCIKEWADSGLPLDDVMKLAGYCDIETFLLTYYGTVRSSSLDTARLVSENVVKSAPWLKRHKRRGKNNK